jgi:hypothetical protein
MTYLARVHLILTSSVPQLSRQGRVGWGVAGRRYPVVQALLDRERAPLPTDPLAAFGPKPRGRSDRSAQRQEPNCWRRLGPPRAWSRFLSTQGLLLVRRPMRAAASWPTLDPNGGPPRSPVRRRGGPGRAGRGTPVSGTSSEEPETGIGSIPRLLVIDRRGVLRLDLRGALNEEAIAELLKRRVERPETGSQS